VRRSLLSPPLDTDRQFADSQHFLVFKTLHIKQVADGHIGRVRVSEDGFVDH
jgi:hypothetical protein